MRQKNLLHFVGLTLLIFVSIIWSGCFKVDTERIIAYDNNFEGEYKNYFTIFGPNGIVDSTKIVEFNKNKVFGLFSDNALLFRMENLPNHNVVKIEFDLFIHDNWKGNYIEPGRGFPDIWQMKIGNTPIIITTFSNDANKQSYPNDYQNNLINNPPLANSWGVLLGACSKAGQTNGTSLYKIEYLTGHTGTLEFILQDINFSGVNACTKSWSIDNLRITAINN